MDADGRDRVPFDVADVMRYYAIAVGLALIAYSWVAMWQTVT